MTEFLGFIAPEFEFPGGEEREALNAVLELLIVTIAHLLLVLLLPAKQVIL